MLDFYPNARFGYSFRRLRDAYTGACIRVRRASDNVEQDIGFINEGTAYWIDENALVTFTGASKSYVVKIYDQGLTANDAIQNTALNQLEICNAGIITKNGTRPTFVFTGIEFYNILEINGALKWSTFKIVTAANVNDEDTPTIANSGSYNLYDLFQNRDGGGGFYLTVWGNEGNVTADPITPGAAIPKSILSCIYAYNSSIVYQNATNRPLTSNTALTNTAKFLVLGKVGPGNYCTGDFQEYVFYSTDQTTNRTAIVTNINAAFLVF